MAADVRTRPSDTLAVYTRDVARHRMLTVPEERALGALALKGDEDAQSKLVLANLRFVITVAQRYRHRGIPLMDLIQAGNIGLMHAAKKFDPEQGVKFVSYAIFWIQQSISKEIDNVHSAVHATPTQQVRNRRVKKIRARYVQEKGREPTVEELMAETQFTRDRVVEALEYRVAIKSLDEPVNPSEGSSTTLGQVIGYEDNSDEKEHEEETRETVSAVLAAVLSPRERKVVELYYGFGGRRPMSLTEIGLAWSISRERARQLKERALRKLGQATQHHEVLRSIFTTQDALEERRTATAQRSTTMTVVARPCATSETTVASGAEAVALVDAAAPEAVTVDTPTTETPVERPVLTLVTEPEPAVAAPTVSPAKGGAMKSAGKEKATRAATTPASAPARAKRGQAPKPTPVRALSSAAAPAPAIPAGPAGAPATEVTQLPLFGDGTDVPAGPELVRSAMHRAPQVRRYPARRRPATSATVQPSLFDDERCA